MPALRIPRRRSILIETIHHSRVPTDQLLFLQPWRSSPGSCSARENSRRDCLGGERCPPPRRPFVDPATPGIQFYRISRNFDRTVGFGLSPPARSVRPRSSLAFFSASRAELCATGFASFRGISFADRARRAGFSTVRRYIAFR